MKNKKLYIILLLIILLALIFLGYRIAEQRRIEKKSDIEIEIEF